MFLSDISNVTGECFTFQQEPLRKETPDFIQPDLWPPNAPELNPVDCLVCSILLQKVYGTRSAKWNIDILNWSQNHYYTLQQQITRQWRHRNIECLWDDAYERLLNRLFCFIYVWFYFLYIKFITFLKIIHFYRYTSRVVRLFRSFV